MKLAISNIAWQKEADPVVSALMDEAGFRGIEIAPTKVWERPLEVSPTEARSYRRLWKGRGIDVVALQALLFGRPELTLFGGVDARNATLAYLRGLMGLAEWLGARVLVFGAPGNRRLGDVDPLEAEDIAVDFFRRAGALAREHGVILAIEPNPREYGCDFVTTSDEGRALVAKVNDGGFGLHLDAAAMTLANEEPRVALASCGDAIRHFHVSEPNLGAVGSGGVDHRTLSSALQGIGYREWVSVEMRPPASPEPEVVLRRVLQYVSQIYGGDGDS